MTCTKQPTYASQHQARVQCRNMGNRFRAYPCPDHGGWHVTKETQPYSSNIRHRDTRKFRLKNQKPKRGRWDD